MKTQKVGHAPITVRKVSCHEEIERAGDFYWSYNEVRRWIGLAVPSQDGFIFNMLPVIKGRYDKDKIGWGWDGNEDLPSLTPSLHAVGDWHGHVKKGVMKEC